MNEAFSRTALQFGEQNMRRLAAAHVAVFGLGGVGGHCAEALARGGVGALTLIDSDTVAESNLNRQLVATRPTLGLPKVDVMRERILSINPDARVTALPLFYGEDTAGQIDLSAFDYIADAIDTVSAKLLLARLAAEARTPLISSMGAGGKLDPTAFRVADVYETSVCPLARIMRKELRRMGVPALRVVYSTEAPTPYAPGQPPGGEAAAGCGKEPARRPVPASNSFVPATAGLILAGEILKGLTAWPPQG